MNEMYDVVIIGGGAAGLSGAVALLRSRRSVLVIDSGEPRNAPAGHLHNFLTRDGTPPAELLALGREEVEGYGGQVVGGRVDTVTRSDDGFRVGLAGGTSTIGRRILVATGAADELPDLPGIAEGWGRDVLHCPYCHGWEVRDKAIGILAGSVMAGHQALLFRQLSDDITVFTNGVELPHEEREKLAARRIALVDGAVAAFEDGGVRLADGSFHPRDVLTVQTVANARADFLKPLGLELEDQRMGDVLLARIVPADPNGRTAVPGVWIAGNVANGMAQLISSASAGLMAAAQINFDLADEQAGRDLAERNKLFDKDAWEERYGTREPVWSGKPNAQLVAEASTLKPGTALDAGCGEGGDAIWLAEQGWAVTGADFSQAALDRAAGAASARGLSVDWVQADLRTWTPPARTYDLVTASFIHLPPAQRTELLRRLADAVVPGGTLLITAHHQVNFSKVAPHQHMPDLFYGPEDVTPVLDRTQWTVEVAESRARTHSHDGNEVTIHDTVVRAQRAS
jgi:thioredoxin reductase/SAM-dependent methyltransferase